MSNVAVCLRVDGYESGMAAGAGRCIRSGLPDAAMLTIDGCVADERLSGAGSGFALAGEQGPVRWVNIGRAGINKRAKSKNSDEGRVAEWQTLGI